jgi:hypothetical protein
VRHKHSSTPGADCSEALRALNLSVDGVDDCCRVLVVRGSDGDDEALAITDAHHLNQNQSRTELSQAPMTVLADQDDVGRAKDILDRSRQLIGAHAFPKHPVLHEYGCLLKDISTTNGLSWKRSELRGKTMPGNSESNKALAGQAITRPDASSRCVGSPGGAELEISYE